LIRAKFQNSCHLKSSISQRTRSKKALRSLPELDIPVFDESPLFIESPVAEESKEHCDYATEPQESIDDRLDRLTQSAVDRLTQSAVDRLTYTAVDNFAGSLLYTAFHYPRLFAFMCVTGVAALAVAVSNAYPCDHSPPLRCYL